MVAPDHRAGLGPFDRVNGLLNRRIWSAVPLTTIDRLPGTTGSMVGPPLAIG